MTQGTISLLATLASFADEKTITKWVELLLPKEVVKNMSYLEKFEYLQQLKQENNTRSLRGGEENGKDNSD